MNAKVYKFSKTNNNEFFKTLKKRVDEYFQDNEISKYANYQMIAKTIFMILLYFIPYAFVVSGTVTNPWGYYVLWVIMGFGMSGIGLSIMHDANHGSYSKNKSINQVLGGFMYLLGGSAHNWKIQHNRLHHSFTNVEGADEDLNAPAALRFSPRQKRMRIHKLQYVYAWLFYGLMTIYWITAKDFKNLKSYRDNGLVKKSKYNSTVSNLIVWKFFYYAYALILPLIFSSVSLFLVLLSFLSMHFIAGFVLTCIFQTAHVMPSSEFPEVDESGMLENEWAVHQLLTTTNYSPKSQIFSWFVGGLNFQVEHHLFPNICHVHYKKISKIVEDTAKQYGLPYYYKKNFVLALWDHAKMLWYLGKYDFIPERIKA